MVLFFGMEQIRFFCFCLLKIEASVNGRNPVIAGRRRNERREQTRTDPRETVRRGERDGRFRGCRHRRSIRHEIGAERRTAVTFRGFSLLTAWAKRGTKSVACALIYMGCSVITGAGVTSSSRKGHVSTHVYLYFYTDFRVGRNGGISSSQSRNLIINLIQKRAKGTEGGGDYSE